jgi:hypothetical protein
MSQQQHFEFRTEDREYWSAENQMNILNDITIQDLTWENTALKKDLDIEKATVRELTQQLAAAKKKIKELTGEEESEEQLQDHENCGNMPERSYCDEYEADAEYEAFIDREMKKHFRRRNLGMNHSRAQYYTRCFDYMEDVDEDLDSEDDNENNTFFGRLPTDGEPLEPEGFQNN